MKKTQAERHKLQAFFMIQMAFQRLLVWQKAMLLTKEVYSIIALLPAVERYGLAAQLRRSSVSVPSNIAEGSQRMSDRDFAQYLLIAKGSLAEMHTQLLLCVELGFIQKAHIQQAETLIIELDKMLHSFRSKLGV